MRYEKLELDRFPPKQKLRMLQNAVGDVTELGYVKQIADLDIARGKPPLSYDSYMELLLSACSTYDKKLTLPGKQKRAVYAASVSNDDVDYRFDDTLDGEYEVFQVDTDINDIMAYNTDTNRFGKKYNSGKPSSTFLPRDEWNKLTQDQKDRLIAKRRQERMNNNGNNRNPFQAQRQANVHDVGDIVDLDAIIDHAVTDNDLPMVEDLNGNNEVATNDDTLLAYMAGRSNNNTSAGDIRYVLAAKRSQDKGKSRKVNESKSAPSTVQIGDTTYYLNKGETITFQEHH